MTDHLLDFADGAARLRVRDELLCIIRDEQPEVTLPLKDIAAVVLAHPQITCTRSVLSGLAEAGAAVVVCGDNHLPVGMCLPLTGYHAPARRFAAQAKASRPTCKRLWQQVVQAKVRAQGRLLHEVRGNDFGLFDMAKTVRSGDPMNIEAQAARIYWPALFNSTDFLRQRFGEDQNRYLNYGYAVLRAITGRAICAAGLHPGLGIHHHHRNNSFCLADDLMEPFRPIVDRVALELIGELGDDAPLDKNVKKRLIGSLTSRYDLGGESRTLFDIQARLAASLAAVFEEEAKELVLPDL